MIDAYRQQGYLHLPSRIEPSAAAVLRTRLGALLRRTPAGLLARSEPGPGVGTAFNPRRIWMVEDLLKAGEPWTTLVADPRIVAPFVGAIGPDVDHLNTFARIKPQGNVSHLSWHQDWPHDRHERPALATVILYLDDTCEASAATAVAPGSHTAELPCDALLSLTSEYLPRTTIAICARAGDLLLTHPLLVHRAGINTKCRDRCAILIQAKEAGLRSLVPHRWTMAGRPLTRDSRVLPRELGR